MSRACCDRAWCVCGHAPCVESSGKEPKQSCPDERDSASAIGDTRISRRAMQTIDTPEEARKTTPKHEFACLHDVGRLREWLKQHSCTENIRGFQGLTRYKSGLE